MRWRAVSIGSLPLVTLALTACGPGLGRKVIASHPPILLTVERPRVVSASAHERPAWLEGRGQHPADSVELIGQGSASARETAQKAAERDLFAAVAGFVSTDVQSEFEATETFRQKDGEVSGSFSARSEVHAQVGETMAKIQPDSTYWEQVETPGQGATFHYYVHAIIPKAEIERSARLAQLQAGALVVVLPFLSPSAQEGEALRAQLSDRLSPLPGLEICPWALVAPLLPEEKTGWLGAVREGLAPTLVVTGSLNRQSGRLEAVYIVHDGQTGSFAANGRVERNKGELFELQDELAAVLERDLAAVLTRLRGPQGREGR